METGRVDSPLLYPMVDMITCMRMLHQKWDESQTKFAVEWIGL